MLPDDNVVSSVVLFCTNYNASQSHTLKTGNVITVNDVTYTVQNTERKGSTLFLLIGVDPPQELRVPRRDLPKITSGEIK